MITTKIKEDKITDNRTWWVCPNCEIEGAFFSVSPYSCPMCGRKLPELEILCISVKERLSYHLNSEL